MPRCQSHYCLLTMQFMIITLWIFGRPLSGHPTILMCVRWPENIRMMSGHQLTIVGWSIMIFRCLSNFRPVIGTMPVKKISSTGVYTAFVRCMLLWLMTLSLVLVFFPWTGYSKHWIMTGGYCYFNIIKLLYELDIYM